MKRKTRASKCEKRNGKAERAALFRSFIHSNMS